MVQYRLIGGCQSIGFSPNTIPRLSLCLRTAWNEWAVPGSLGSTAADAPEAAMLAVISEARTVDGVKCILLQSWDLKIERVSELGID